MKQSLRLLVMSSLFFCSINAVAQQKPPAGRTGLDPSSRTKISMVKARAMINPEEYKATVERSVVSGPSGKNCVTNIASPSTDPSATKTGGNFGVGKNKDQIVVVDGPVINLCK